MKTIKINFVDFWPNFIKIDNYFYNLLATQYNVVIDENNPDVLFFSVDYNNARERDKFKNCLRIFFTGENVAPNWDECDIAFTFRHSTDEREYRLPLWALHLNWFHRPYNEDRDHANLVDVETFMNKPKTLEKSKFCGFVASQPKGKRVTFVPTLARLYKTPDCAGRLYNNVGNQLLDSNGNQSRGDQKYKIIWGSQFKFNIAMENCASPGYCTEKIIHAMFSNSIPIYWGSDTVEQDFNPDSFINCHKYASDEEVVEVIKELDNDNKKLADMLLRQPWFKENKIPDAVQPENVLQFLNKWVN
mgnify:CR=1 FL=1